MTLGLRQIRYFIAIADAGVLSRAAETLNVAQSALSHHVAALETDLGVKVPDEDLTPRRFETIAKIEAYFQARLEEPKQRKAGGG